MNKEVKRLRLEFDVQRIEALKKLNDEFLLVKIYAMACGKNRNFTYISKEDAIAAIPSAYYCPVIGHIRKYIDSEGQEHVFMGSHDIDIDENWEIIDVTRPYGVIVENSEGWETINEHGIDVEYLTFDAILWIGRYPELKEAAYSDEILFNQSMEITIDNYRPLEEDSNYWELLGFSFSAFCLLGKADKDSTNGHTNEEEHSEPAFISARVVPYELNIDEFKKEFSLLKDKISQFCLADETVNTIQGGNSMAEVNEVMDTAVTEFEETSNESTAKQIEDTGVSNETVDNEFTNDDTNDEHVEEDTSGEVTDEVTEDETAEDATDFEALYNEARQELENLQQEYDSYRETHSNTNDDYQVLFDYRERRETEDRSNAETELFSSFENMIGETDEYIALQNEASKYSLEDLKMRLYAIVGMYANTKPTNENEGLIKFSLNSFREPEEVDPYGGAKEYYL